MLAVFTVLTVVALAPGACDCGAPVDGPPPPIGAGTPIGPPDAGDIYEVDAGPKVCDEDAFEDNDARADAAPVTGADPVEGRCCGGDDDWFSVESHPGCDVDARMSEGDGGDVDLLLFDPDGQLVGSSGTAAGDEAIHVPTQTDGAYALRLRCGSRDDVAYQLTLTSTCAADLVCPADDPLEDNDSAAQPAGLDEGVTTQGILCGPDEDWFQSPVSLGCIADARLDFSDAQGDIDLELYAGDGVTRIATSNGTGDEERLLKVVTQGGMRYRAFLFNAAADEQNTYRFIVKQICSGELACPSDDPFEPNDARADAVALFAADDEAVGVICNNDDFYSLAPQSGCTVHATLSLVSAEGDLDLELQKADGSRIDISQGTGDTESIDFTSPDGARVVLRVLGFNAASNHYRLHVSQDCP